MRQKAEIRLDILIVKEDNYFLAHCLQFDIVATNNTLKGVKKDIIDLCVAHINYSVENNNLDYLFSPAPKEVWAKYISMFRENNCTVENTPVKNIGNLMPLSFQEIYCHA